MTNKLLLEAINKTNTNVNAKANTNTNAPIPVDEDAQNRKVFLSYFLHYKGQIAAGLPKHMNIDRFCRACITEYNKNKRLAACTTISIMGAIMQCAQLGLEPGSTLGKAFLIPHERRDYKSQHRYHEAQFMLGYRGMIDLVRRSKEVIAFEQRAVYEKDMCEILMGTEPKIEHRPFFGPNKGRLVLVYSVVTMRNNGKQFDVMSCLDIENIRQKSKCQNSGPWQDHYEEMAKKTVTRRLFKMLPETTEINTAITLDEQMEAGVPQNLSSLLDTSQNIPIGGEIKDGWKLSTYDNE